MAARHLGYKRQLGSARAEGLSGGRLSFPLPSITLLARALPSLAQESPSRPENNENANNGNGLLK
jgi:hypothetical protein